MGTIADKLTYLNGTKTAIKTAIQNRGVEVADNDTFRSYAEKIGSIGETVDKTKFGVSIDDIFGDVDENGMYRPLAKTFELDLSAITGVCFSASVVLPDGTRESFGDEFAYRFYGDNRLIGTIDLSNLSAIEALLASDFMESTFYYTSITKVILPQKTIKSYPAMTTDITCAFNNTFSQCKKIKEIVFPSQLGGNGQISLSSAFQYGDYAESLMGLDVIEVLQGSALYSTFRYSKLPEEIRFTSLREISNHAGNAFSATFGNCTGCKRFYFPVLTIAEAQSFGKLSTNLTWYNNKDVEEIHFRADMQSTIEALYGYSSKFGATNATIYFDL